MLSSVPTIDAGYAGDLDGATADLLVLIRAEYHEMPGLRLTLAQASRLFGIDTHTADVVMRMMVDAGELIQTANGTFMRREALM